MAGPRKAAGWEGVRPSEHGSQWPRGCQPGSAARCAGRAMLELCCHLRMGPVGLWVLLVPRAASHLHAQSKAGRRRRAMHPEEEWG